MYSESQLQKAFKSHQFVERYGYILAAIIIGCSLFPLLQWVFQEGRGWAFLCSVELWSIAILYIHGKRTILWCRKFVQNGFKDELFHQIDLYRVYKKRWGLLGWSGFAIWGLAIWWAWEPLSWEWFWPTLGILFIPLIFWFPYLMYWHRIQILQFFCEYGEKLMKSQQLQ